MHTATSWTIGWMDCPVAPHVAPAPRLRRLASHHRRGFFAVTNRAAEQARP